MTAEEILNRHELKNTGCRKYILTELIRNRRALSEPEIKSGFPNLFDRVTIYRTLRVLEESGIIHKIVLNDNSVKYALSHHTPPCDRAHSHFHCTNCNEVLCLPQKTSVDTMLPQGFTRNGIFVIIEGLCAKCNHHLL